MLDTGRLGLRDHAAEIGGAAIERQFDQRHLVPVETLDQAGDGILAEIVVLVDRRDLGLP